MSHRLYRSVKRVADVVVGCVAFMVAAPVIGVLSVAVMAEDGHGAIYRQVRLGRGRKPFVIYKLRSMAHDAEPSGPALSSPDDPRVTKVGRWMRRYHLDELPQLWNVVKGEMSLVGPRPEREHYAQLIEERAPEFARLYEVRPGLTSLGMVRHGYAADIDGMMIRLRYDVDYVARMSLWLDVAIMFSTVKTVISGKGI